MTTTDPSPADVVGKLRALCVGHPYAKVAWPHRILHEAADLITRLLARAEKAERERDRLRDNNRTAWVAMRMIREAVEEFGPVADLESSDAVLLRGPEATHEAEAIVEALIRVRARVLYAAPQPAQVAIKPLEWRKSNMAERWVADHAFGQFEIVYDHLASSKTSYMWFNDGSWETFGTLDEAKAAAQAAYETRIRSALIPSPADGAVEALAKEATSAYLRYLDKMQSWECSGEDAKLKEGSFGARELKAHREASELLGIHRGIHKALATLNGDTP